MCNADCEWEWKFSTHLNQINVVLRKSFACERLFLVFFPRRFHWLDPFFYRLKKVVFFFKLLATIGRLPRYNCHILTELISMFFFNWLLLGRVHINWIWTNLEFQCNQCKFDLNFSWQLFNVSHATTRSLEFFLCSLFFGWQKFWQCLCVCFVRQFVDIMPVMLFV